MEGSSAVSRAFDRIEVVNCRCRPTRGTPRDRRPIRAFRTKCGCRQKRPTRRRGVCIRIYYMRATYTHFWRSPLYGDGGGGGGGGGLRRESSVAAEYECETWPERAFKSPLFPVMGLTRWRTRAYTRVYATYTYTCMRVNHTPPVPWCRGPSRLRSSIRNILNGVLWTQVLGFVWCMYRVSQNLVDKCYNF